MQHQRQHEAEAERVRDDDKDLREGRDKDPGDEEKLWSAKTQEIRNRLDGHKRMAAERWNRFAGTEGAGARGL